MPSSSTSQTEMFIKEAFISDNTLHYLINHLDNILQTHSLYMFPFSAHQVQHDNLFSKMSLSDKFFHLNI